MDEACMPGTGALLRDLHRIHQQLGDLRERMERGPKQIKAREANVARADAEVGQAKAELKAAKVSVDQKQLQLKSGEGKIGDLRVKLNQANSNREYQALKDQIAADEMANSVLADEILEGLERIDGLQKAVGEAEQKLAKAKDELAKAQALVRDQGELIAGDVTRLEAELKEMEKGLPADFAEAYRRSVRGRGADALAMVEGENCGGCYQVVTANIFSNLLLGKTVVVCQSCGRMLYLPEDRTPGR
ncbi:MAG TPA: phospholipase [Pirellulales bacterium]|nr:phospholipase [Pirellulales bacterium]